MKAIPAPEECRRLMSEERLDPQVIEHVEAVAALARKVAEALRANGHPVRVDLVNAGALLHDLGRARTQGIDHALTGARMLRARGYPEALVRCVERHTGGGIDEAEARALSLPPKDYTPRTLEEKVVCQVDNLFDGSRRQRLAEELADLNAKNLPHVARKVEALHKELSRLLDRDLDTVA